MILEMRAVGCEGASPAKTLRKRIPDTKNMSEQFQSPAWSDLWEEGGEW